MNQNRVPLDVSAAINRIMARVELGETEVVPLAEANGRYLAEDLIADHPVPSFNLDRGQTAG
ncbi:molybdopterin biosynthesis enzyme [Caldalkalibacillus uzonensis]|uniref:Molybdopterin biosynthesis enzyme n=1 Tax=Caldalkalibacillus uzonensis TaxID=353224 RepID=A0ABU0CTV2_9BACI|nr:hypothetical protein [Caldalkalibacillus uzonensis]MDQ0338940.1 molybdopterin biosynthesis enzyme [Caldalkalibacillus uzonensis]